MRPPGKSSCQRSRFRFKLQRTIVAVTNRCICTLNRLYSSPSFHHSSQPDNNISCSCCRPSDHSSTAQLRVLAHLREQCAAFVLQARTWATHLSPTCDISPSVLDLLASIPCAAGGQPPPPAHTSTTTRSQQDSLLQAGWPDLLISLPSTSSFSSAATAVVPLIAERISLPKQLKIVPMLDVLPPAVAAQYTEAASPAPARRCSR